MGKERCTAIVLAAGQGRRMNSKIRKQFLMLGGHPVLYYSLRCFQDSTLIRDVVLVTGAEDISYCKEEIVERYHLDKVKRVIPGGKERYDSVYAGLLACCDCDYVFIHDGARPFVTGEIVERGFHGALESGACVIGMPSKDTVKLADEQGFVRETPDRGIVWNIQTPQIFRYELILGAYRKLRQENMSGITDDAMVAEQAEGTKVKLVEGSYENIKITTQEDLAVAESFLKKRREIC